MMEDEFKDSVKRGFTACKTDIETLKFENKQLKETILNLQTSNNQLISQIQELTAQTKGIQIALDYIKEFNQNQQTVQQVPQPISNSIHQAQPTPKDSYEALLAFKAKSNKREILKQKLISMIHEEGIDLAELRFLFVDHHRYCSRATFYNYLKELEAEQAIKQKRQNSKTYLFTTQSQLEKEDYIN